MAGFPHIFKPKPGSFGINIQTLGFTLGAGTTVTASATTSVYLPIPRRRGYINAINIQGGTAAAGGAAITAQVIKKAAGTTDKAQCAATSLTNSIVTAEGNFAVAITAAEADRFVDPSSADTLRIDLVAAGTVTTQPKLAITVEYLVRE